METMKLIYEVDPEALNEVIPFHSNVNGAQRDSQLTPKLFNINTGNIKRRQIISVNSVENYSPLKLP